MIKIKALKDNLFASTRVKLDIIASIFIFLILFSFSFVVYKLLTEDIIFQISPVFKYLESKDNLDSSQFFSDLQKQTFFLLIVSDIVIFTLSIFFFDIIVKRMLKPIEYVANLQKSFASNVSHELRTPLSIMNMRGEILMNKIEKVEKGKDDNFDEKFITETKDGVGIILKEVSNLTDIIDDLLFEARIKYTENKKENISLTELDTIITNILENQEYLKNYKVSYSFKNEAFEKARSIKANPIHLERIFTNLISNSFKFTKEGEVKVTLKKYERLNKEYLSILVEDTGVGISKEEIPKIFERFYRGKEVENEVSGSGLGLSIVRDITTNNNWHFKIKSSLGSGTIIEISRILLY